MFYKYINILNQVKTRMLPPQNLPVLPDTSSSSTVSIEIATAAFNCEKGSVIIIIIIFGGFFHVT